MIKTFLSREIIRLGGLETETEYPYEQEKEPSCKLERSDVAVYINDSLQLPKDEEQIAAYLLKHGPISIGNCLFVIILPVGGVLRTSSASCPLMRSF